MNSTATRFALKGALCLLLLAPFTANAAPYSLRSGQLGLGVMAGSPTGLTLKYWFNDEDAVDFAVGNLGYYVGRPYSGVNLHFDYLRHYFGVFGSLGDDAYHRLPLYLGFGGVFNDPGVAGVRGVFGVSWLFENPFEVFFELAPTLVLAPAPGTGLDGGFGARFYF